MPGTRWARLAQLLDVQPRHSPALHLEQPEALQLGLEQVTRKRTIHHVDQGPAAQIHPDDSGRPAEGLEPLRERLVRRWRRIVGHSRGSRSSARARSTSALLENASQHRRSIMVGRGIWSAVITLPTALPDWPDGWRVIGVRYKIQNTAGFIKDDNLYTAPTDKSVRN